MNHVAAKNAQRLEAVWRSLVEHGQVGVVSSLLVQARKRCRTLLKPAQHASEVYAILLCTNWASCLHFSRQIICVAEPALIKMRLQANLKQVSRDYLRHDWAI